jgi:hypothetical protein
MYALMMALALASALTPCEVRVGVGVVADVPPRDPAPTTLAGTPADRLHDWVIGMSSDASAAAAWVVALWRRVERD